MQREPHGLSVKFALSGRSLFKSDARGTRPRSIESLVWVGGENLEMAN